MSEIYRYTRADVMSYPKTFGWCMDTDVSKIQDAFKVYREESIKLVKDYDSAVSRYERERSFLLNKIDLHIKQNKQLQTFLDEKNRELIVKQIEIDSSDRILKTAQENFNKMKCCGNCDRNTFVGCGLDCSRIESSDSENDLWEMLD